MTNWPYEIDTDIIRYDKNVIKISCMVHVLALNTDVNDPLLDAARLKIEAIRTLQRLPKLIVSIYLASVQELISLKNL